MPLYSDMNGFPESGFPVLADLSDRVCLGTLYPKPLMLAALMLDVVGNSRLLGSLIIGGALSGVTTLGMGGALSGVTTLGMGGALSGVTTIGASGLVTLSGASPLSMTHQDAVMLMTGLNASMGTLLQRIRRGFFTDLEIKNKPTVDGDPVVVLGDLARYLKTTDTATGSDVDTGTDDAKFVTSKALADSKNIIADKVVTGEILLGENTPIVLNSALSADGKYCGIVRSGTAGAALEFGRLCYLDPTDSRWEKCDASAAAAADGDSRGILGICVLAATGDGEATKMLLWGTVRADTAFPTMTVNNPMYVSETAGEITGTQPTTTDVVIRIVGQGMTGDELFFNPSPDYITHT